MSVVADRRTKSSRRKRCKRPGDDAPTRPVAMVYCQCARCREAHIDWPAYYTGSGRLFIHVDGRRRGMRFVRSYECYLERNPPEPELEGKINRIRTEADARREGDERPPFRPALFCPLLNVPRSRLNPASIPH